MPLATNLSRALAASARQGSALLAAGIFGGLLIPPLAHALRGIILPTVVGMMIFLLLRVDPAWVAQATIAAFAVDFGLNALTTIAFLWTGWRAAASAGLLSGNRNIPSSSPSCPLLPTRASSCSSPFANS